MSVENEAKAVNWARENDKELYWALSDALVAKYAPKHKCGDCNKWMRSRECPREHNVKGMSRGPSCADSPCDQFQAKPTR